MSWYRTGTVSVAAGTAGSTTTVTGVGTDWISGAAVGEMFYHTGDSRFYEITAIASATSMTIMSSSASVAISVLGAGASYHIAPTQSYIRALATQAAALVNDFASVRDNAGAGKFGAGTLAAPGVQGVADANTGLHWSASDTLEQVAGGVSQATTEASGFTARILQVWNAAKTFKNIFANATTAVRTWTFPDKSGVVVLSRDVHDATSKTSPVDADELGLQDSAASFGLKSLTWANLKATLATWLNGGAIPARFTSLAIGIASGSDRALSISGAVLSGATQYGLVVTQGVTSAASYGIGLLANTGSAAAAYTLADAASIVASTVAKGAGSTITNAYGVRCQDQTQGVNNYGVKTEVTSGANKWNIYASGTAANYFAGSVGIGTLTPATVCEVSDATYRNQLTVHRAANAAATTMGSIALAGNNSSTTKTTYAQVEAYSVTVASGAEAGALVFSTIGAGAMAERLRIDNVGQVGVGLTPITRNNTRLQIVDGIGFPATQVASSDANTLDDYEEGTFTPTIVGTTVAGAGTYVLQVGRYQKVGNRVHYCANVNWSAHTGTGNMRIGGLPFTSNATAGNAPPAAVFATDLTFPGQLAAMVANNSSQVYLRTISSGSALAELAMDTAAAIYVSGHYEI